MDWAFLTSSRDNENKNRTEIKTNMPMFAPQEDESIHTYRLEAFTQATNSMS